MEKVKVTGVKFFKDVINGEAIDSGKVMIEERLNDRNNEPGRMGAKGYSVTPYPLENAKQAETLMNSGDFPLVAEVEFETMTNGKGDSKRVIVSIKRTADPVHIKKAA